MIDLSLRGRLRARQPMVCLMMTSPNPDLVEIAAAAGVDFAILDAQHGPITAAHLPDAIRAGDAAGIPVLVRVPGMDRAFILQSLEAGATGILVPEIETAAQAQELVELAHYAPNGKRSVGAHARAQGYSKNKSFAEMREQDAAVVVAVNIETPLGVANAEEIMSNPGIDFVMIGVGDLKMLLGDGDEADRQYEEATRIIGALGERLGVSTTRSAANGNILSHDTYTILYEALHKYQSGR